MKIFKFEPRQFFISNIQQATLESVKFVPFPDRGSIKPNTHLSCRSPQPPSAVPPTPHSPRAQLPVQHTAALSQHLQLHRFVVSLLFLCFFGFRSKKHLNSSTLPSFLKFFIWCRQLRKKRKRRNDFHAVPDSTRTSAC